MKLATSRPLDFADVSCMLSPKYGSDLVPKINGEPFTCENKGFATAVHKGQAHGDGLACGSVFSSALLDHPDYSLWLEHVTDKRKGTSDSFWLMWYDRNGNPTITVSGVFGKNELRKMTRLLTDFIQVP